MGVGENAGGRERGANGRAAQGEAATWSARISTHISTARVDDDPCTAWCDQERETYVAGVELGELVLELVYFVVAGHLDLVEALSRRSQGALERSRSWKKAAVSQ